MAVSIPLQDALLVLELVWGMLMLMVWQSWPCLWPAGSTPSQDMVACFSEEETVSLRALRRRGEDDLGLHIYLFLWPAPAQVLENQEVGAVLAIRPSAS